MKILKYPLALLVATWITGYLAAPITLVLNLLWLQEKAMPLTPPIIAKMLVTGVYGFGSVVSAMVLVTFTIAFIVAALLRKWIAMPGIVIYALAGAAAFPLALFIGIKLVLDVDIELITGNRTLLGKGLHSLAGLMGGIFFGVLIRKERTSSFFIRTLVFIPFMLLSWSALNWMMSPAVAALGFGFDFATLSDLGRNTAIRDMTAFFFATSTFLLLGMLTLNSRWLFAASLTFMFAMIFNYVAIHLHGTSMYPALYGEVVLFVWIGILGLVAWRRAAGIAKASALEA